MNLAVRRFLLFFFSIATLASCDDPTDIGIDLQDENQIGTDFTDTITINSGTVLLSDSVLSFKSTPAQVGHLADPVLGTLKATTFTEVSLGGSDVKFGDNPVADSLVLTLDYSNIYGNRTQPLKINVFRLTEGFQEKASYFTNTSLARESTPLGSTTLVPLLYEKKKVFDQDSTAAKRLVKIKLSQSFINELVAQSGQAPLKTQASFEAFLKGLAIASEGNPSSILALNLNSDSSKIVLHYKNGADKKKHIFRFAQSQNVSFFTKFEGNRSGTAVATLQNNRDFLPAKQTGNESFIQNNTQLVTKLTLPYLQKFKEKMGNVIINRAELIVPVKAASTTTTFVAPPQLVLYQTNSTNRILKDEKGGTLAIQQNGIVNGTSFPTALVYDSKRNRYALNITSYFQAMMLDKKPNNGLLLAPANVVPQQDGSISIITDIKPNRAIISNTASNKIKLVVYYSKLN